MLGYLIPEPFRSSSKLFGSRCTSLSNVMLHTKGSDLLVYTTISFLSAAINSSSPSCTTHPPTLTQNILLSEFLFVQLRSLPPKLLIFSAALFPFLFSSHSLLSHALFCCSVYSLLQNGWKRYCFAGAFSILGRSAKFCYGYNNPRWLFWHSRRSASSKNHEGTCLYVCLSSLEQPHRRY